MEERREEERKDVSLEVRWEGGSGHHTARVSDLSLGGCYLDTLGQAVVGEVIGVEIKMPDGSWLPLRGTVAFYKPGLGFSVCFTFLTDEEQYQLSQIINQ
ncbi:MAG: PilZ domain-containing protein [Acidobacteriota bacterium]|nr:PilZ domain-containing protein [Acidobacteriota bacterium]